MTSTRSTSATLQMNDIDGNVKWLVEYGVVDSSSETPDDDLILEIDYFDSSYPYFHAHPETLRVFNSNGDLLRYRTGSYYPDTGKMNALTQYDTDWSSAVYTITYDKYGNLATLTDPKGFRLSYQYDDEVATYIKRITSSNCSKYIDEKHRESLFPDYQDGEFVTSGPVFELFRDVNPVMNRFDLWKVTSTPGGFLREKSLFFLMKLSILGIGTHGMRFGVFHR